MDNFKKYLLENKNRLDLDDPPEHTWDGIKIRISRSKKKKVIVRLLKWSAAACIITLAGIGLYTLTGTGEKPVTSRNVVTKTAPADDSTNTVTIKNKKDTVIAAATHLPKKIKKRTKPVISDLREMNSVTGSENFPDRSLSSFIAAIENQKTIISSTPVFGVEQDHFKGFVIEYKNLEKDEQELKDKIKVSGVNNEILDEMINTLKKRIDILIQLKAEIDKVNNINKNKGTGKTYVNII